MQSTEELERMAQALSQSKDYRVLRRLTPRQCSAIEPAAACKLGVILDVETTGLDTGKDEIIELGMVKFSYDHNGQIKQLVDKFCCFNEPSMPIPQEVVDLTGITDQIVAGCRIDSEAVSAFVSDAVVVIAHNANFDRRFCERYWPTFVEKHWACSASQVDWRALGFEGTRLAYILNGCGYFHDAHRAVDDCLALFEVLAVNTSNGPNTLSLLLENARKRTLRIWADNAPFELRAQLKKRKYRWNDGSDGRPRCWYVDVNEADGEAEMKFLKEEIYRREGDVRNEIITSLNRFSVRA